MNWMGFWYRDSRGGYKRSKQLHNIALEKYKHWGAMNKANNELRLCINLVEPTYYLRKRKIMLKLNLPFLVYGTKAINSTIVNNLEEQKPKSCV